MSAPTPRPHAERAPEGEVTAAVERAAEAIRTSVIDTPTEKAAPIMARAGLDAALGVEEMARAIDPRAFADDLDDEHFATRRNIATLAAQRIRAAMLGGAA